MKGENLNFKFQHKHLKRLVKTKINFRKEIQYNNLAFKVNPILFKTKTYWISLEINQSINYIITSNNRQVNQVMKKIKNLIIIKIKFPDKMEIITVLISRRHLIKIYIKNNLIEEILVSKNYLKNNLIEEILI